MKTLPPWHYDEMHHVGVDFADPAQVAIGEVRLQQFGDQTPEYARVCDRLGLYAESRIIDIGCGTGGFALFAAQRCAHVYAADVSLPMLDYARRRAESAGVTNITFCHGGFLTYEHLDEPVDAVVSMLALHHLPDFWKLIGLQRIPGMLKSGGHFYLKDLVHTFNHREYQRAFEEHADWFKQHCDAGFYEEAMLSFREESYTLDWIMEGLLTRAGFTITVKDQQGLMHYWCMKE